MAINKAIEMIALSGKYNDKILSITPVKWRGSRIEIALPELAWKRRVSSWGWFLTWRINRAVKSAIKFADSFDSVLERDDIVAFTGVGANESRLKGIEEGLRDHLTRLDGLDEKFDTFIERFDKFEGEFTEFSDRFKVVEKFLLTLKNDNNSAAKPKEIVEEQNAVSSN